MSPCFMCAEKSCKDCPCAVVEIVDNEQHDTNMMKTAMSNAKDCNVFLKRLVSEANEIEWSDNGWWKVMTKKWRGFPAYFLSEAAFVLWVNNHYQKEQ